MTKDEKILKLLLQPGEIQAAYAKEALQEFFLTIEGKPENYVRERSGRGRHFYNPKAAQMEEFKQACLSLAKDYSHYAEVEKLIASGEEYEVEIDCSFYLPTQKSCSARETVAKELRCIVPTGRPDLDNYLKFVLDALHGVFYDDDSKVTRVTAAKYYSMTPRTELTVRLYI